MKDPFYRITTFCPTGISNALSHYLDDTAGDDTRLRMRDVIALNILRPFETSVLPFCCTILGWVTKEHDPAILGQAMASLEALSATHSNRRVSMERFSLNIDLGTIQIAGAYPLVDLEEDTRGREYEKISFNLNRERTDQLLSMSYQRFLNSAMRSDDLGLVCAVLANSEMLAEEKIKEMVGLILKVFEG